MAGRLNEVSDGVGAVEARVGGAGDEIVDAVTELVEQGHDFVVFEQAGFLRRWFGEVADESRGGISAFAVFGDKALRSLVSQS